MNYKPTRQLVVILQEIVRDLSSLPVKDAVFNNSDIDVTEVVKQKDIDVITRKYANRLHKIKNKIKE